ncbi:MAG: TonB-dependent receptor [Porticoccaceae bacterium]|nr:TonB-dependent receptor [Porticoccaceae bacterium]
MKKKPLVVASLLMPGLLLGTTAAQAQLQEIVVTANKRAESANDIGLSISAISGDKLAEQKLTTLEEITSSVPGLVFATSDQNTPILTLRGVGFNESSIGVYPATSLYVDEIPLPFPVMAAHSAYDLERVEVLKGPQGVLFGQNSTGGAVNFIAAKPTQELSYGGDLSYGRFNKVEANGFVSGGLTDRIAGRLAVQSTKADEWQRSMTSDRENGEEDYTAARLSLRFEPSDNAEINLNINGWRDKSDPQAFQLAAVTPRAYGEAPENAAAQFAHPLTDNDNRSAEWTGDLSGDKEFIQYSLRGDVDLNDSMTLTGLVAHSEYEQDQVQDGDGMYLVLSDWRTIGDIDSTFAELRLAGDYDSYRWVVGVNYEDSSTYESQYQKFEGNTSSRAGTLFIHRLDSNLEQEIKSYAAFANVDFDVTDSLTLKLGTRYTDYEIDAYSCNGASANIPGLVPDTSGATPTEVDAGSNLAALFNILGAASGVPFDPIGIGGCISLNDVGVPGFPFINTLSEDNVSWRAGADYRLNDDVLLYANISKGYKAGSYPTLSASDAIQLIPVRQESVLAYEAGFKVTALENSVQWNGALFYYEYDNKQEKGKIANAIFGPLSRLVNVPEASISGIETDVTARLTDNLTLTAAVTYLDSEIDEYTGYDVFGQIVNFAGEDLPYTPEFTYSLDVDYRMPLSQGGVVFMGMNVIGQSNSEAVFNGDDLRLNPVAVAANAHKAVTDDFMMVDSYATLGARLGYESEDTRWRYMLWGKNLTDEYYWNNVAPAAESIARIAARPRTYGITLGYTY